MFRTKKMSLAEWAPFQNRFEEMFTRIVKGDKGFALFIEADNLGEPRLLLIPSQTSEIIEALSPGGWDECENAFDLHWTLLVGNTSAYEDFGLKSPT